MSPLLIRLEEEYRRARDDITRGEIQAKRAAYIARTGDCRSAREIVSSLRSVYSDGRAARVVIWIMIAEALIFHYEDLNRSDLDKITRAQLLSRMIKDRELEAITSAWRAHIEFEYSMFAEMFVSLQAAHRLGSACNCSEALSRVSNIACKIGLLCGEVSFANRHFIIGRDKALLDGDQASIEALQHNKAAFRLSRLRSSMCFGSINSEDIDKTRIEILSAKSLQYLTRITALSSYIDLCWAHLLIVEGKLGDAINALIAIRDVRPFPVGTFSVQLIDVEIAFCLASLNRTSEAMDIFSGIDQKKIEVLDADERLFARWMQVYLTENSSVFGDARVAREDFQRAASDYHEMIDRLKIGLKSVFESDLAS